MKTRDTQGWRDSLNDKTSVTLYKEHRKEIGGQDEVYTNDITSDNLLKCRTNTLTLNDRKRFTNEGTDCWLCS